MSTTGTVGEESTSANSFGAVYIKDPLKKRKCPLCQQNLYLYNLNYEEMMLMCENIDCDYPFGYEALQVVSDESELQENPVAATAEFSMYPVNEIPHNLDTVSTMSTIQTTSIVSDTDNTIYEFGSNLRELEDDTLSVRLRKETRVLQRRKERKRVLDKQIKNIQRLNTEMVQLSTNEMDKQIKKEKWLKNLKMWESSSGKKLLTDLETKSLKKEEYALGEFKLDVKLGENVPSLNIEICLKDVKLNT